MPLVTNAEHRSQSAYGSFQPRADLSRHGVAFAAINDGGDGRFPHIDNLTTQGVPVGTSNKSLVYTEFKDKDGKPHDVSLPNGMKVREMICDRADILEKDKIEAQISQEELERYTQNANVANRVSANGLVQLTSAITEQSIGRTNIAHDDPKISQVAEKRAVSGWTPERRAAQGVRLAASRAAKSNAAT